MNEQTKTKKEVNTKEPKEPQLTELSVKLVKEQPVQLYQIELESAEEGKRIKNYRSKTEDFEWWVDPQNIIWKVPDGDYLVVQGPEIWFVGVKDGRAKWRGLEGIVQEITARWNKLILSDKAIEEEKKAVEDIYSAIGQNQKDQTKVGNTHAPKKRSDRSKKHKKLA